MTPRTHLRIDPRFSGRPLELSAGKARLEMTALPEMAADDRGLVHGGFVFSLLDHAAMLAVNEPTVVLGQAEIRFLAPVRVGERLEAEAEVTSVAGKKHLVRATARRQGVVVAEAELTCFVPARHVLDRD